MILLGIESATELVGVAVGDDDGPRAAVWASGRRRHAEALAPAVEHVLDQAEVELSDLAAIAVDLGPGLFTGLRVGVATAKGLAQGLGIGVVGLTSLEVLAAAALDAGWPGEVAAVVDARRGEVFVARYGAGAPRGGRRCRPARRPAAPPRPWPTELARAGPGVLAVGDGARRYAGLLDPLDGVTVAGPSLAGPRPEVLVALAVGRLAAGEPADAGGCGSAGLPARGRRPYQLVRRRAPVRRGPGDPGAVAHAPAGPAGSWPSRRPSSPSPGASTSSPPSWPCGKGRAYRVARAGARRRRLLRADVRGATRPT